MFKSYKKDNQGLSILQFDKYLLDIKHQWTEIW